MSGIMSATQRKLAGLFREISMGAREFFLAPLKRLYYIGHILFLDVPRFVRRACGAQRKDSIRFHRLAERAVTFHEACALIEELNWREGLCVEKSPILCEEFCRMLYQDLSCEWRLPTPKECAAIWEELVADATSAKFSTHPALFAVWTLGDGCGIPAGIAEIRHVKRYAYAVRSLRNGRVK